MLECIQYFCGEKNVVNSEMFRIPVTVNLSRRNQKHISRTDRNRLVIHEMERPALPHQYQFVKGVTVVSGHRLIRMNIIKHAQRQILPCGAGKKFVLSHDDSLSGNFTALLYSGKIK